MKVEVKGENLVITIPLQAPRSSKSGKTFIVANTNGFIVTEALEPATKQAISVSVNATIKK